MSNKTPEAPSLRKIISLRGPCLDFMVDLPQTCLISYGWMAWSWPPHRALGQFSPTPITIRGHHFAWFIEIDAKKLLSFDGNGSQTCLKHILMHCIIPFLACVTKVQQLSSPCLILLKLMKHLAESCMFYELKHNATKHAREIKVV
jgi:hypothetical protein